MDQFQSYSTSYLNEIDNGCTFNKSNQFQSYSTSYLNKIDNGYNLS